MISQLLYLLNILFFCAKDLLETTSLPSQGEVRLCTHYPPQTYLWDYTGYVVVVAQRHQELQHPLVWIPLAVWMSSSLQCQVQS
uniref:Putative ovule protein n=1 Tax=Solanum chacoense TaxID=4108 RepID=A0A0V0GX22_SOLCH